jgi:hypothetical protein
LEEEKGVADEQTFPCRICGEKKRKDELVPAGLVRAPIDEVITREHPARSPKGYICRADLNRFRIDYVRDVLEKEKNEYALLKEPVSYGMKEEDHLPENINVEFEKELTFGGHLADKLAVLPAAGHLLRFLSA